MTASRRAVTALAVVVVLLAGAVVVGGVATWRERSDRSSAAGEDRPPSVAVQERYGAVLAAARATATALVNIDYRSPQDSQDAVAATATGTFLDQYEASSQSLVQLVTSFKSVLEGEVVEAAVDDLDADSATVLVATEGTVSNAQTGEDRQARNFRLYITLVNTDGRWLTNDLEFAG
ncbi:hypothetical protein [Nocardioides litoris]|uniref:hypothetical protein n=1 Tax=Nocardioides litoris TaxID=1926648 RepID=UPI00112006C8|nr:hypothetical protein [Nocardioides litoris]